MWLPGRCRIGWWASERTADPTFTALAGASTAKCKPLDGVNVWDTIAAGQPSPRTEMVYNLEPYRAALRQGDWKLVMKNMQGQPVLPGEDDFESGDLP